MSRPRLVLPLLALLTACGPSGDPADATYAPALEVDLAKMEKRESGLYVQDLAVGTGPEAVAGKLVLVHLTGWLTDGTQFTTTREEGGAPAQFVLGAQQVLPGLEQGVEGMQVGGKRKLVVPSTLGLGKSGYGIIPPNAVLVFDVELVAFGPSGDPAEATFAPELAVDLSAMEKRESGLYVQDLAVGTGAEALPGMMVTVHYTGWLTDGTQFDSSRAEGRSPFQFTLGVTQLIAGFEEGVEGMKVGGKRKLVIPSALAYGIDGSGSIPPNAVLIFEVELLEAVGR